MRPPQQPIPAHADCAGSGDSLPFLSGLRAERGEGSRRFSVESWDSISPDTQGQGGRVRAFSPLASACGASKPLYREQRKGIAPCLPSFFLKAELDLAVIVGWELPTANYSVASNSSR
jgi:hypothetical protein